MPTLEEVRKQIDKEYGEMAVYQVTEQDLLPPDVVSTGSLYLDWGVLRIGGLPRGRTTELSGPEGSGKTTVALQAVREAQMLGLKGWWIDAEHKLDLRYAKSLGVDLDELTISYPADGEEALAIADRVVEIDDIGILVIDSVAALGSQRERKESDFIKVVDVSQIPRSINKFFRRKNPVIRQNNVAVVMLNQLRVDMASPIRGATQTPGGKGLQFYATILLHIRYIGKVKDTKGTPIGHTVKMWTSKNSLEQSSITCTTNIYPHKGIRLAEELLQIGAEHGIITKRGSYYSIDDERIGQGLQNATDAFEQFPKETIELVKQECIKWLVG